MSKQIWEADLNNKQRMALAKKGMALADGSYPITNAADLKNAISAYGRAADKPATKQHIIKRATELGQAALLPEDWKKAKESVQPVETTEGLAQGSTSSRLDFVRSQFCAAFPDMRAGDTYVPGPWVRDIYLDEGYVVCEEKGRYWHVDFSEQDGKLTFTDRTGWKELFLAYVPAEGATAESHKYTDKPPAPVVQETKRSSVMRERVSLAEGVTDDEHFTVRGVTLIKAGFSANTDKSGRPRYYPPEVLKANGVKVFEGAHLHINHPSRKDEENRPEGDALGVMGWYENVRFDDETRSLKGDQVLVERRTVREELWPLIKATVERKPDLMELSINAIGTMRVGKVDDQPAVIVESIERGARPARVDIVTRGAAGGTYQGALLASDTTDDLTDDLLAALTFEQWRESHPDYIERLKTEWKTVRETEALKEAKAALDTLTQQHNALNEQHRATIADLTKELTAFRRGELADRLLAASTLPHTLRAGVRADLVELETEADMKALVEREQAKFKIAPKPPVPVSGAGQRPASAKVQVAPEKAPNLSAQLLGLNEALMPKPGESAEAYKHRRQRAQAVQD